MITGLNLYRVFDVNIKPRDFEIFCMETLKLYAEQEQLQNFRAAHDQKVKKQPRNVEREIVAVLDRKLQSICSSLLTALSRLLL